MTEKEARLFLQLSTDEDVKDRVEEIVFEQKQFFINKPLIPKLLSGRMERLSRVDIAYRTLTKSQYVPQLIESLFQLEFSQNISDAFHEYQRFRMELKGLIMRTHAPLCLIGLMQHALKIERKWVKKWVNDKCLVENDQVVVSKEIDPMEFLAAIKQWMEHAEAGTFDELHSHFSFLPDVLKHEVKRLTLLHEKYLNEGI